MGNCEKRGTHWRTGLLLLFGGTSTGWEKGCQEPREVHLRPREPCTWGGWPPAGAQADYGAALQKDTWKNNCPSASMHSPSIAGQHRSLCPQQYGQSTRGWVLPAAQCWQHPNICTGRAGLSSPRMGSFAKHGPAPGRAQIRAIIPASSSIAMPRAGCAYPTPSAMSWLAAASGLQISSTGDRHSAAYTGL